MELTIFNNENNNFTIAEKILYLECFMRKKLCNLLFGEYWMPLAYPVPSSQGKYDYSNRADYALYNNCPHTINYLGFKR